MSAILEFFDSVGQFFSDVWDIIKYIFDELVAFFKMIKPAFDFFGKLLTSLHPIFLGFGIAMLLVLIIYVILGRTAGGD